MSKNEIVIRPKQEVAFPARPTAGSALSDRMTASINRQKRFAYALIALFFGGFLGWATVFDLASAAIAPGIVSPEGGARLPVQHFEGGIISEVLIKDGDRVKKGQPLIILQETRAKSQVNQLADQRAILEMRLQRLTAERRLEEKFEPNIGVVDLNDGFGLTNRKVDKTNVSNEITPTVGSAKSELANALNMEAEIFHSRRESLLSQEKILKTQISQLHEEINGLKKQIGSIDTQLDLIKEEIGDLQTLLDKGLGRKPPLLAKKREKANLLGQRATATARIARANQSISQSNAQISDLQTRYVEATDREMSEVRTELVRIVNQLENSEDVLARTTLSAPESGVVVGLTTSTENAVVRPGDIILEIVPGEAALLIDAKVSPLDIDDVREGQKAQIILPAYKQRHMPRVYGIVQYVSADSLTDERTGAVYFLARVSVDEDVLHEIAPDIEISDGMLADVMTATGEQTLFNYLIGPFNQSLRRSFREK